MDLEEDPLLKFSTLNDSLTSVTLNSSTYMTQRYRTLPAHSITLISQEILLAIVCLVGLLGNTLVIYVVNRFSKMQTVTNTYIVNLAIADECFLIGIPFLLVTMIKSSWIFGELMCKAYLILTNIGQFTSSIFLSIMIADRYIAVCHPISSPKFRPLFISRCVSVTAWFCSIMLIIPIFKYSKYVENWRPGENGQNVSVESCVIVWAENSRENSTESQQKATTFILNSFVFNFAIPLCLTLIFYCLVIQKLKTVGPKNKSKETNLVLTVATVYVLCWFPYWIAQITMLFTPSNEGPSQFVVTIHLLAFCLSYLNSAINPILYAFLSDNFKKSFLKACTCAAGKDINATLRLENSVSTFEKHTPTRVTSIGPNNDEDCDAGLLVSKAEASTSRSNTTLITEKKETPPKDVFTKNALPVLLQPATNL